MQTSASVSNKALWASRILCGLPITFFLFDGIAKLFKPAPVVEATVRLGIPDHLIIPLGLTLTICTILFYAVPRTSHARRNFADWLSGRRCEYAHVRMAEGWFPILFPVFFGVLLWGGLYLRELRLQALTPLTTPAGSTTKKMLWAGYVLSLLPALLLLFSAFMKLSKNPQAVGRV